MDEKKKKKRELLLIQLLTDLGSTVGPTKVFGCAQEMVFLGGLELDTNLNREAAGDHAGNCGPLPSALTNSQRRSQNRATALLRQTTAARRNELDSALGCFTHIATAIIYPTKAFLRRLRDTLRANTHSPPRFPSNETCGCRTGLQSFWVDRAARYNGTAILLQRPDILLPHFFSTDGSSEADRHGRVPPRTHSARLSPFAGPASGTTCGTSGIPADQLRARTKHKLWPPNGTMPIRNHINYKESFAIWWALPLWGPLLLAQHSPRASLRQ